MDIGTGKVTQSEMNGIKHHLIDIVFPDEDYNAASFVKDSEKILNQKANVILVGGTLFYIQALVDNSVKAPKVDDRVTQDLMLEYERSPDSLYLELQKRDIEAAEKIHKNDEYRITRALSVIRTTGEKYSSFKKKKFNSKYRVRYYVPFLDRDILYDRINKRVDYMVEAGLFGEVENILNMGYSQNLKSLNTLGYKEVIAFLNSDISKDQAITKIKQETRRYAKRQLSWLRGLKIDFLDHDKIMKTLT
jgi:tRNA dimethylallyltransferase